MAGGGVQHPTAALGPVADGMTNRVVVLRTEGILQRLSEDAPRLLQKMPPDAALEEWLKRYSALIVAKRGLKDALQSIFEPGAATYAYSRDRMTEAATLLLYTAAKSGAIRSGIDPQDVLMAVAASTWSFAGDKDWKERAGRVLRLVMDGLRYRGR